MKRTELIATLQRKAVEHSQLAIAEANANAHTTEGVENANVDFHNAFMFSSLAFNLVVYSELSSIETEYIEECIAMQEYASAASAISTLLALRECCYYSIVPVAQRVALIDSIDAAMQEVGERNANNN